ncbi:MAG: thymidylate kinase [marine bacterium B5-7]|nr:MAG: thymidylate kinase [marine bacterium B5-7]
MTPGKFITIEGIEGAGKSTAMKTMKAFLESHGKEVLVTREPGGTPLAEKIRTLIISKHDEPMQAITELLLFFAGRAQHITNVIQPALAKGIWVLGDRFTDASYAYQSAGRSLDVSVVKTLEKWVGDLQPDCTLLLDVPVALGMSRIKHRAELDRIEEERTEFFERVRAAYLVRAKEFSDRFRVIDASKNVNQVKRDIKTCLEALLEVV